MNRMSIRDMLASLMASVGARDAAIERIEQRLTEGPMPLRIDVANLQPGDILVFSTDRPLSDEEFTEISERIKESPFADFPRVLLEDGMTVRVLRQDGAP